MRASSLFALADLRPCAIEASTWHRHKHHSKRTLFRHACGIPHILSRLEPSRTTHMLPLLVQRSNLLLFVPPLLGLHCHHRARGTIEVVELLAAEARRLLGEAVEEHLVMGCYDECRVGGVVDQVMF